MARTLGVSSDRWRLGAAVAIDGTLGTGDVVIAAGAPGAHAATLECFSGGASCDVQPGVGVALMFWLGQDGLRPYGYIPPSKDGARVTMGSGSRFGESLWLQGRLRPTGRPAEVQGSYLLVVGAPQGQLAPSPIPEPRRGLVYLVHEHHQGLVGSRCVLDVHEAAGMGYMAEGLALGRAVALEGRLSILAPADRGLNSFN